MKQATFTIVFLGLFFSLQGQMTKPEIQQPPTRECRTLALSQNMQNLPLKGGGDVFWKEEFNWGDASSQTGWFLPAGWILGDPTDLGYNWHWANDTLKGVYTNEPPLASTSRANGFLALNLDRYNMDLGGYDNYKSVDNSITSPEIDCSGQSSVLVRIEQNFRYWSDADMLFEVTNDKGVHWASFDMEMGTLYSERVGGIAPGGKVDLYLNLTEVAAGMPAVQFKITWKKARLYYWMIDDITFMEGWENDLQMLYYEANYDNGTPDKEGFFYSVPKTQISGYDMMGIIKNFGNADQWGTHLNVKVMKNNQFIYDENSAPIVLYSTLQDTFRIEKQFVPTDFGHYRMDFATLMDNTDEIPRDNYASIPFHITDSVFSRCDDAAEISFSTWGWYTYQHEGDLMGTWYTMQKDAEINSISCYINRADIRVTFRYVLFGYNEEDDAVYELLGSDFMEMDSTILKNHWVTLPLIKDGEGEFLVAGKSYLIAIEMWNNLEYAEAYNTNRYSIGSDRSNFYPSGKSWFLQTNDQTWYSTGNDLLMLRMYLKDNSNLIDGTNNEALAGSSVSQNFPNPFTGETQITYKLSESSDVVLEIRDITGKLISQQNFSAVPEGEHTITLNAESFQPGSYLYTLTGKNFTTTHRMMVTR